MVVLGVEVESGRERFSRRDEVVATVYQGVDRRGHRFEAGEFGSGRSENLRVSVAVAEHEGETAPATGQREPSIVAELVKVVEDPCPEALVLRILAMGRAGGSPRSSSSMCRRAGRRRRTSPRPTVGRRR